MRKLFTAVFFGIALFAILGLALGPTLQTAAAHSMGKVTAHCETASGCFFGTTDLHDSCILGAHFAAELGQLHFIDIDGDKLHDHGNDGANGGEITRGEPTICLEIQNLHPRDI